VSDFIFASLPQLSLQLTATNTVLLSWPSWAAGFVLEENSDLTTTNWVAVAEPVNRVNSQNQVVAPLSAGQEFYRLVIP
jgi:hypothetical protein